MHMARKGKKTRKCQHCGIDDTLLEEMEFEMTGGKKPKPKYYHKGACWEAYQERKAFLEKEDKELDELRLYIEEIYGLKQPLNDTAYVFLQRIRNGQAVFRKQTMGRRYKQGYEYPIIKATFEHIEDTIHWANRNKDFDGFDGAFRYALKVVIDKLYIVEQKMLAKQQKEAVMKERARVIEEVAPVEEYKSSYKKKKDNNDISDFLD
jgi:hypothetical protein